MENHVNSVQHSSQLDLPIVGIWPSKEAYESSHIQQPNPANHFENPYHIEDVTIFDREMLQKILLRFLSTRRLQPTLEDLAHGLHHAPLTVVEYIETNLPPEKQAAFRELRTQALPVGELESAHKRVLDTFFWEMIYWKNPELYDELTSGELIHPGVFQHLETDVRGAIVLDVAAGTGRATIECLHHQAKMVYAVDPASEALDLLERKLTHSAYAQRVIQRLGYFESLPLENDSVDLSISCSAFQSEPGRGGDLGLAELLRVTKAGGKIVIIWPSSTDYGWFERHGFQYVTFPKNPDACIHFRSLESALKCVTLFYARNQAVMNYLHEWQKPEIPYSLVGFEQPRDYCWLRVKK
jgi:ubiquinone/menaquinone biosynthesis C-methylase UbiE